eukprot:TRINITY_DN47127_c0_g1_i1.p1 TRINITY_DN47127_c0_g1~~TRINITY_DN47127_c0_g1_i1.p1  ORF type:complete len:240 (+),score=37.37 TRINITY_DN47127_c0_g1_i1:444-1163(+)
MLPRGKERVGKKKKPPLAPLSTGFIENHKPVHRLSEGDKVQDFQRPERVSGSLSQITPWLYLGSLSDALDRNLLKSHGIDYILNTAKECESGGESSSDSSGGESPDGTHKWPQYLKLDLVDHADEAILSVFQRAFSFIEHARRENKKVLVHCRRGISRSATLVIAYLMQYLHKELDDAFNFVRNKRSIINPNLGFVLSLETFAQQLGHAPKCDGILNITDEHSTLPGMPQLGYGQPIEA